MASFGDDRINTIDKLLRQRAGALNSGSARSDKRVAQCQGFDPDLAAAYQEKLLSSTEQEVYESHLADCHNCRRMMSEYLLLFSEPIKDVLPAQSAAVTGSRFNWAAVRAWLFGARLRWAATAALFLLITGATIFFIHKQQGSFVANNENNKIKNAEPNKTPENIPDKKNEDATKQPEQVAANTPGKEESTKPGVKPPERISAKPSVENNDEKNKKIEPDKREIKPNSSLPNSDNAQERPAQPALEKSQPATSALPPAPARPSVADAKTEKSESDNNSRLEARAAAPVNNRKEEPAKAASEEKTGGVAAEQREQQKVAGEQREQQNDDQLAAKTPNEKSANDKRAEAPASRRSGVAQDTPLGGRALSERGAAKKSDHKDLDEKSPGNSAAKTTQIGNKTFLLINGVWTDKEYVDSKGGSLKRIAIKYNSDEYQRILKETPALKSFFELGRVIVIYQGAVYIVTQ